MPQTRAFQTLVMPVPSGPLEGMANRPPRIYERNAPGQLSFISLTDWPMKPLTPERTGGDMELVLTRIVGDGRML